MNNISSRPKTKWFAGIDSIRFVLAFIVMLSHYENPFVAALKESHSTLGRYTGMFLSVAFDGVAAVIAFFIISGFVIHYPNKAGIKNIKNFYIRRYLRVLIPLIVIKLISIPFGSKEEAVVWSLYCELIYYTIYPLLLRINLSWNKKMLIAFLIAIGFIGVGAKNDLLSMFHQTNINYNGAYWQLGTSFTWLVGLPCWLMGVVLADQIDKLNTKVSVINILAFRTTIFAMGVIAVVLKFHFFVSYIFSMTVLALPIYKWVKAEIQYYKTRRPITFLETCGKFSYSLYLCHPLLFVLISLVLPLNNYTYFLYLTLGVAASYFFYLLLEKPSHLLAQRLSSTKEKRINTIEKIEESSLV